LKETPKQRPIKDEGIPLAIIPASWCLTERQYNTENLEKEGYKREKLVVGRFQG
jgi:hypothetical protein